jgi:hypothetical protein
MCQIENQVMRVEERIQKMDEDRSPETEDQRPRTEEVPQDAEPSQPRRRYAVVYSAGDTTRIMRTASTSLGAVRQAQSLVEWLTKGEEDGINVTLDGATVQAAVREDVYIWSLVLRTARSRPARGRISIWREM